MPNDNCNFACTEIFKFVDNAQVPPQGGIGNPFFLIDGYRYINIMVKYSGKAGDTSGVEISVAFSLTPNNEMSSDRYITLEENVADPKETSLLVVSGKNTAKGDGTGSYIVRIPVMGKYIAVVAFNHSASEKNVSVWGYGVS
jgi:hypothetical protein